MSRQTILVVDDSEYILEFLGELLRQEGFTVLIARDGGDAMSVLQRARIDLLLTDLNMPNVSGMELIKHTHHHHPDVIIVIMTGYASLESARDAIAFGVVEYVFKPFKSNEIITAIENSFERVNLRRENSRLREALALSNASQVIAETTSANTNLAETIVMSALTLTRTRYGALVVFNDEECQYELRYAKAPGGDEPGGYTAGATFSVESLKLAKQGTFLATVDEQHPLGGHVRHTTVHAMRKLNCPEVIPIRQEALFVPLRAKGLVKAVLVLSKEEGEPHFAPSDLPVLSVLSNLSGTALDNASLAVQMEQTYVNTLISLNMILEAKHPYTKGHTQRVVELCIRIGRELGLNSGEIQDLREGAMLHDIGKLAISDAILNKPGPLTDEELEIVRQHPVIGDNIIRPIKFLQHCRPVVRSHHERWDGGGYPDGLKGEEIHLFARICTIADTVDAMASERSYRAPLSFPEIYDQVLMGSGTQFDENLVKIVLGMIERGEVANIEQPRKLAVG
jgi:response regulator RpfG family c-di-GMP phosphodiesterase